MKLRFYQSAAILNVALSSFAAVFASPAFAADASAPTTRTQMQERFATPEAAAAALVAAVRADDPKRIRAVLGPGSDKVISSGDPVADQQGTRTFRRGVRQAFEDRDGWRRESDPDRRRK